MSVIVIGDLILDVNYMGNIKKIASEAPVPVIEIEKTTYHLGGAANVANNLKSLGIDVKLIGMVGNDINGTIILNLLKSKNIDVDTILINNKITTTIKNRVYSNKVLSSRFDIDNNFINNTNILQIKKYINYLINDSKIFIISDYLQGLLNYEITRYIIDTCNDKNILTFVDPKCINYKKYKNCTMFKPNRDYSENILNDKISLSKNILNTQILEIIKKINCKYCMLTLDKDGLVFYSNDLIHYPIENINVIDVVGSGDCVIAAFTYYYLKTNNLNMAAEFANYCGQLNTEYIGQYVLTNLDIINYKIIK